MAVYAPEKDDGSVYAEMKAPHRPENPMIDHEGTQRTDHMTNTDLVSLLTGLSPDTADELIQRFGGFGPFVQATADELEAAGLSPKQSAALIAAVALGHRLAEYGLECRTVHTSEDVYQLVRDRIQAAEHEHLYVVVLDAQHRVRQVVELYRGTVGATSVRVAEIIAPAVRLQLPYLVMVHNHPSGDPTPSSDDVAVTGRVRRGAETMGVELLDHIVVGAHGFVSMKQRGLGF